MGIGAKDLDLLITLREKGFIPDEASVMEIGAQQLSNTFLTASEQLKKITKLFGVPPFSSFPSPRRTETLNGAELLSPDAPHSRFFWEWLGFSYNSIDIDETPYSIAMDLNYDEVPFKEQGKYDIVTNYGTTEHVANQLNAFKIIHDLTALNGIMIHSLPAQGLPNHGLVNYNPKFFWMLARSNGYHWLYMDFWNSPSLYVLPQNILEHASQFNPEITKKECKLSDAMLFIVLQKKFNTPYVAALDVNTGTKTSLTTLKNRYWSVFTENAFENILPER